MVHDTALIASPLFLLLAGLGMAISRRRRRDGIAAGMTGDEAFTRLQRAHGNAAEHIPLVLVGLLLLELAGGRSSLVLGLGGIFVLARLFHVAGIITRSGHPLHVLGAAGTYFVETTIGVVLARAFFAHG
jgi:uncharacterized protein